jgi:hypothetical protein
MEVSLVIQCREVIGLINDVSPKSGLPSITWTGDVIFGTPRPTERMLSGKARFRVVLAIA